MIANTNTPDLHKRTPALEEGAVAKVRRRSGSTTIAVGLILTGLAVLPGVISRFDPPIDPTTPIGRNLQWINAALLDIKFGSGLRFWLGVVGASMMASLLFYPIRKVMSAWRWMGSVTIWFKIHLIFGFAAPVAILYHANFGLGGFNANIALWCMLAIVASGIIGHYVHATASAQYYSEVQRAHSLLQDITQRIDAAPASYRERASFIADLTDLNASPVRSNPSILRSIATRIVLRRQRRGLAARASAIIPPSHDQRANMILLQSLNAYFSVSIRSANRALREQMWARWRLFHMPLFAVMTVATGLHVAAVWGVDQSGPDEPAASLSEQTPPPETKLAKIGIKQVRRSTLTVAPATANDAATVPPSTQPPETNLSEAQSATIANKSATATKVIKVPSPALARRPSPNSVTKQQDKPIIAEQTAPHEPEMKAVYTEVQRRMEPKPMGLGGAFPRSLTEQIELLKSRQKAGQFAHTLAETGFPLTGKHTRVECSNCHKVPLKEERQATQRQCVNCHKKDDVHRGRRNECANCHTTNRWSEIIRRR